MGGLVVRSACHAAASAGHRWPGWLRRIVFLGTPHCGGVVERGGKWLDLALGISPHSAPFARLRKVRSAGWTDLKRGVVLEEDGSEEEVRSVPLPAGVECYAMAAVRARERGVRAASDGLVPLNSALGRHTDPPLALSFPNGHTWVGQGMNHLDLLSFPEAYEVLSGWLSREPRAGLVPARVQK